MQDHCNFEHIVKQKCEGRALSKRILFIIGYLAFLVEYEYMIVGSTITFSHIYGKKTRKNILDTDIKSFSQFAVYDEDAEDMLGEIEVDENYIFISSPDAPEVCYAMIDEEKMRYIIYFEAPEEAISIIKRLNPSAFRHAAAEIKKHCAAKSKQD